MPVLPHPIPGTIPFGDLPYTSSSPTETTDPNSLFDVAVNGIGFMYASSSDNPMQRQTAPFEKNRIDSEQTAGEQTLLGWWLRSQDSFHGGAGQLQLEPSYPTQLSHVRFDVCKNCDVFTPGLVKRLPDTVKISTANVIDIVGINIAGVDALVYLAGDGTVHLITSLDSSPSVTAFTAAGVTGIQSLATDGKFVYASNTTTIYGLDPSSTSTATTVASYPSAVAHAKLGWAKARLMAGADNTVYQVDVGATGVTLGTSQLLYTHPTAGWTWKAFGISPTAILAGGDAGGQSTITQFTVQNVAGAPTLQVDGEILALPVGERINAILNSQGTFLAVGTTKGFRIGQFDSYWSRLTDGPLVLSPNDPLIPCNALLERDRFIYAVGMDYDEAGLIAVDLGTQIDNAPRYAWSPHLVSPSALTGQSANAGAQLPNSGRLVFTVPSAGIFLEGVGPGSVREAWLRTSRIRFGTSEPKLFKLAKVRGTLATGECKVTPTLPDGIAYSPTTVGFTTTDPVDFKLPGNASEWLQLKLELLGSSTQVSSYIVKALTGTHRQRDLKFVLACYDTETTKSGQRIRDALSARQQLNSLEALDNAGDEVTIQEFTPNGVISTLVVIQSVTFTQVGRPTRTSDLGGTVTLIVRTVDS